MILFGLLLVLVGALGLRKLGTSKEQARLYHLSRADSLFCAMIVIGIFVTLGGLFAWMWAATS